MATVEVRRAERPLARVVRERLSGEVDPVLAARWLRGEPRAVALSGSWAGGGTVLSSHPLVVAGAAEDPFAVLDSAPFQCSAETGASESLVAGGWFGWLGFGLARSVEAVPPEPPRSQRLPRFDLAFHDHVVRCDPAGHWWFEALWTAGRSAILGERLARWRARLAERVPAARPFRGGPLRAVGAGLSGHRAAVAETVGRIASGELSQANICLRFESGFEGDPLDLWVTAAAASRAAYAAYIGSGEGGHAVVSLSPELFLRRRGDRVQTRPIKGTAPAGANPAELVGSAKDRAENVMIVDLMRNDLGRVCRYGSVKVDELFALRPAAGVWHLESSVSGRLWPGVGDADLLRAAFPPGSVTGAPKVQALRTIHQLESTARESYCGAIGFRSPLQGLELNVAIRTIEVAGRRLWLGAGGGVVSDSSPAGEVEEVLTKARGVLTAAGLRLASDLAPGPVGWPGGAHAPRPGVARGPRPDPALGVFETIRVSQGRAVWLSEHCRRLRASCRWLGLPVPGSLEEQIAVMAAGLMSGGVRVRVTGEDLQISLREAPGAGTTQLEPIVLPGGLGAHKWADRTLIDASSAAGRAPLICDFDGAVLEAGYAAVLLATGTRTIIAPPLDGRLLPSISRHHTVAAARRAGWTTAVRTITLEDLASAEAIILTSCLRGPHPGRLDEGAATGLQMTICQELALALASR